MRVTSIRPGSSPLARGLRPPLGARNRGRGIIPARAGFTDYPRWRGHRPRDHPRSRGVYHRDKPALTVLDGSSPLARGLQSTCHCSACHTSDHPRSRGVYPRRRGARMTAAGSSPLARGLRPTARPCGPTTGIIPARAGFTPGAGQAPADGTDHPRSRGVYPAAQDGEWEVSGSSPLARGLLPRPPRRACARRIIPARAGFTTAAAWSSGAKRGSSPLARGLPCPGGRG